jgi:hypothetical protein
MESQRVQLQAQERALGLRDAAVQRREEDVGVRDANLRHSLQQLVDREAVMKDREKVPCYRLTHSCHCVVPHVRGRCHRVVLRVTVSSILVMVVLLSRVLMLSPLAAPRAARACMRRQGPGVSCRRRSDCRASGSG